MRIEKRSQTHALSVDEALNHGVSKGQLPKYWQIVLSLFAAAYLLPVLFWLFRDLPSQSDVPPPSYALKGELEQAAMKSMIACGSTQCWSVFSPVLNHSIYHETAIITFKDGTSKI